MPSSAKLHLCRHGETAYNLSGTLQGQLDTALNEKGVLQADALGRELARRAATGVRYARVIYSSDLSRAADTARAALAALGNGFTLKTDARLRERSLGRFEGRTPAESRKAEPKEWKSFQEGRSVPGVEGPLSVSERAAAALRDIAMAHPGEEVLVFSHGGTIGCALEELVPGAPVPHITNCSISAVSVDPDGVNVPCVLGDASHLSLGMEGGAVNVDVVP